MKYILTLIFTVVCFSVFGQWTALNSGTGSHLNDIQFTDAANGYCVGENGTFLRTTDGGASWIQKTLGPAEHLKRVHFINNTTGFICSDSNLYWTTDGGNNFINIKGMFAIPSAPSGPMNEVKIFFNGNVGIVTALWAPVTIIAFKTDDGGNTWSEFTVPSVMTGFTGVDYSIVNSNTVYAVRGDKQYKTSDDGASWSIIRTLPNNITGDRPFQVFDATGRGYASCRFGSGFVHMHDDATEMIVPASGTDPHSFSFLHADTGYIMQENKLYKTEDGGMTRNMIHTFTAVTGNWNRWHLYFVHQSLGFLCGRDGKIYKTSSGATSLADPLPGVKFTIYPNPASTVVNLKLESDVTIQHIRLTDISGKTIRVFRKEEKTLSVENIANGTYFLQIQTNEGTFTEKIVL